MLFECDSRSRDYSPVEGKPRLRAIALDKLSDGMLMRTFELAEVRLFRTADFDCSRSGSLRTVFGVRLRLLFAMASGLRSPRRKA